MLPSDHWQLSNQKLELAFFFYLFYFGNNYFICGIFCQIMLWWKNEERSHIWRSQECVGTTCSCIEHDIKRSVDAQISIIAELRHQHFSPLPRVQSVLFCLIFLIISTLMPIICIPKILFCCLTSTQIQSEE